MEHHGHMGHGGMDMPAQGPMCNMNMLFTWDTTNLCIVFKWWRIEGIFSLLVSLAAVVILSAGYELVRELSRRYELRTQEVLKTTPNEPNHRSNEQSSLLWPGKDVSANEKQVKTTKAAFYAVQIFYSFFIMLLFMTYNGWIMLAVAFGAFIGYLGFANSPATKSAACH